MTSRPLLSVVPGREYDLPPRWDDRDVEWDPWKPEPKAFVCARGTKPIPPWSCSECTSTATPLTAAGVLQPLPGETVATTRERRTKRSGRRYVAEVEVSARPDIGLHARRCVDCGHDEVYVERTGEVWDLDEDDYTSAGSQDPATTQGALW